MRVDLVILNYNGQVLLAECLPSLLAAAAHSQHEVSVVVIDNSSTDDSLAWLAAEYSDVIAFRRHNRGLCSYNTVLPLLAAPVAILLNNDIRLSVDAIDPLVAALASPSDQGEPCLLAAPLCLSFDGSTYQGQQTAVRWRWGVVQATSLYEQHEVTCLQSGLTASAGAAVAVWREEFLALGGFDHRYLPGRIEDLDFAFRAYQAGYCLRHVPDSLAYHKGAATFAATFGEAGCDRLALRNTLLFQWKNLITWRHRLTQFAGGCLRIAAEIVTAPWQSSSKRWAYITALREAHQLHRKHHHPRQQQTSRARHRAEIAYFQRFHPKRMPAVTDSVAARQASPSPAEQLTT